MADRPQLAGFGPRQRRLSDQETERRMLDAAVEMVNRTGLTVSLEHLSFEDVIRDAAVSRTTAYRRWPYKYLFFADLLKELAKASTPAAVANEESVFPELREIVMSNLGWLETEQGRRDLLVELMRRGAAHDFEAVRTSTEWRTYLALHATFLSVADDELRKQLGAELAESERAFIGRVARAWERIGFLFGFRLRPEIGGTFEAFATAASAGLRGDVILALANPDLATRTVRGQMFGASEAADWTLPAISIASLAQTFFEPDPAVVWDEARVAMVRDAFAEGLPG